MNLRNLNLSVALNKKTLTILFAAISFSMSFAQAAGELGPAGKDEIVSLEQQILRSDRFNPGRESKMVVCESAKAFSQLLTHSNTVVAASCSIGDGEPALFCKGMSTLASSPLLEGVDVKEQIQKMINEKCVD